MSKVSAASPQQMAEANARLRQMLLASAIPMTKSLATVTASPGDTSRVKLFNTGILTKLFIDVSFAETIGVGAATASKKAPWNLIKRIRLTDYDGTDRINISGYQLWALNSKRRGRPYGYSNESGGASNLTNPSVPTAVGNASMSYLIEIPVAFDVDHPVVQLRDTRGAIMMQTGVGEMYLSIDWNSSLIGDVESLYISGGGVTVAANGAPSISCQVFQEFLFPQNIGVGPGGIPLPSIDLMTVYELNGNLRSSDNLIQNTAKQINYPNVRSVIGAYFNFVNNGDLSNAISSFQIVANGANILRDETLRLRQFKQRGHIDGDLPVGTFFIDHLSKPIETALFGNVQANITPNAALTSPNIEIMFESFYTKGMTLPGIGQV